jgi:tripartite-type tricarboxylate transporter receptor subunit TctC
MKNRTIIRLFAMLALGCSTVFAQPTQPFAPFPNRPVRVIVGAPAGGPSDALARLVSQRMSETLAQPFVVENRPGASGTLGANLVARSPADGYTLLLTPSAHAFVPSMYEKLPFDSIKDFKPAGQIGLVPLVVIVNKDLHVDSLRALVELAKAKPGAINFGSSGVGTAHHLAGELFKNQTGVQMTHVPYKGSAQSITDLIGGQIQVIFEPLVSALPHIQGGKVKAIAVTGQRRTAALPDIPTAIESGFPGIEVSAWYGLLTAANTPDPVVARLNLALNTALADPAIKASLQSQGVDVSPGVPQMFMNLIVDETARWRPIILKAGIHAE